MPKLTRWPPLLGPLLLEDRVEQQFGDLVFGVVNLVPRDCCHSYGFLDGTLDARELGKESARLVEGIGLPVHETDERKHARGSKNEKTHFL